MFYLISLITAMHKKPNRAYIFPAKVLGGHEIMATRIIKKEIFDGSEMPLVLIPRCNKQLHDYLTLNEIPHLYHDVPVKKMQILHAFFNALYLFSACKVLKALKSKFEKIVLVQGDIEQGCVFVLAAQITGIKLTSYIPYVHSFKKMGARFCFVRDALSSIVYTLCDDYITISDCFSKQIRGLNPNATCRVEPNFLEPLKYKDMRQVLAGDDLSGSYKIKIFIIGRVYFKQKGHDLLVNAISLIKKYQVLDDIEVHVIGDGPDLQKLIMLINSNNLQSIFVLHGWIGDVWHLASHADVIVLPSRFEGVPLVMLEAMQRGKSIIASDIDGMHDYLNAESLFSLTGNDQEKSSRLADKLCRFINNFHSQS